MKHPLVAFSVKHKQPVKLDKAVSATMEKEGYSMRPGRVVASVQGEGKPAGESKPADESKPAGESTAAEVEAKFTSHHCGEAYSEDGEIRE